MEFDNIVMVDIKTSKSTYLILGGIPLILGITSGIISLKILYNYFIENNAFDNDFKLLLSMSIISLLLFYWLTFKYFPRLCIKLDEEGIKLNQKTPYISWDEVEEFHKESTIFTSAYALYVKRNNFSHRILLLNSSVTNKNEAVKFICEHISENLIDIKIKMDLKKINRVTGL